MRVVVDEQRCYGSGNCVLAVPDVFEEGDEGVSRVVREQPPPELLDAVREAVRMCPMQALILRE